jgi:hypothetical protein
MACGSGMACGPTHAPDVRRQAGRCGADTVLTSLRRRLSDLCNAASAASALAIQCSARSRAAWRPSRSCTRSRSARCSRLDSCACGRRVSIFLDKNRRYIGKSQSQTAKTARRTQRPQHLRMVVGSPTPLRLPKALLSSLIPGSHTSQLCLRGTQAGRQADR